MSRIVASLLRQFGPSSGSTPAAPAVPTFSVADNEDGTGGVVTIAGSSAGSANVFYAANRLDDEPFTSYGSRTGDGTISIATADGAWWGYVRSTLNSQSAVSLVGNFRTTGPASEAQIVLLADALVTSLNAAALSVSISAGRVFLPHIDLQSLATVSVVVMPRGETTERDSRSTWRTDYRIDIAIRQHVANDAAAAATLTKLAEEIFDLFRTTKPAGRQEVLFGRVWPDTLAVDQLNEQRIFGSVQQLTFRGWRS